MRVVARDGDLLWTPLPVDPARMATVPGLPEPELVSGPLEDAPAASAVVPWGETAAVAALRERLGLRAGPPVEAVVRGNHRAFALGVARELGSALPGAGVVRSIWALEKRLATWRGEAKWVLKAPLSAAGRSRVHGEGSRPSPTIERKAGRLLERHGELILEPWTERVRDLGVTGRVADDGPRELAAHRLLVDRWGHFRGVARPAGIDEGEEEEILFAAAVAGSRLEEIGYRGPFEVVSFAWREPDGSERRNLVCQVNARLTFGHLARVLRRRVAPDSPGVALRTGKGDRPDGAVPLLHPGEDDATSAWMEPAG